MWRALATKRVKEVRFLLNKAVPGTDAAAKFLQNNYAAIKKDNPALPILIRESKTVETAMMVTRFPFGVETVTPLTSATDKDIEKLLQTITNPKA